MEGDFDLPMLPDKAQKAIFPNINHILVSIGYLCDTGCIVTFEIKMFISFKKEK